MSPRPRAEARPADGELVGRNCPICQVQLLRGEPVIACPGCDLGHHDECWAANEGCGAYGCKEAPATIKAATSTDDVAWHGEKTCPGCGRTIKAQALVCLHCKASFWTRDPITVAVWKAREYGPDELPKIRNTVVAVFLASTCGCLFPIMGVFTAAWIWSDSGPYTFQRLPESLRMLVRASFGASCAWGVLFSLIMATGL